MELLEKALSGENIADAVEAVVKNKGACGVDGITTEKFKEDFYNGKINFEEIKEQIRNRKYQSSPVKRVYIPKENGDKRALGIPTVLDRVIQQAIA